MKDVRVLGTEEGTNESTKEQFHLDECDPERWKMGRKSLKLLRHDEISRVRIFQYGVGEEVVGQRGRTRITGIGRGREKVRLGRRKVEGVEGNTYHLPPKDGSRRH